MTKPSAVGRIAFVACRDSCADVKEVATRCGVDPNGFLILSRRDNPALRTIDDILVALPRSIEWLVLDDVEYLLPAGMRDVEAVLAFVASLEGASQAHGRHGLTISCTTTLPNDQTPK